MPVRDVLFVVAIIGCLGMLFVLVLAATKYGEAIEKDLARQARARSRNRSADASEPSTGPARAGWKRELNPGSSAYLAGAVIMLAGIVIGQVLASALDISGVSRILICSAAILVVGWSALGVLMLRTLRRRSRSRR